MKKALIAVLVITNIITAIAVVYLANPLQNQNSQLTQSKNTNKQLTLPTDAVKISECIPYEGEHYVQPDKVPHGPIYTVYNGKVVGLEYMFTPDEIPGEKEAKMPIKEAMALIEKNKIPLSELVMVHKFHFDVMQANIHSFGMNWTMPHSGLDKPHYDLHMFLVDKATSLGICPDAKLENVYSQSVMENIEKYNIPFPKE